MSCHTPEDFVAQADEELAWRKQELSALRFAVETSPDREQPFMIRAATAIVYAHWEGYVKDIARKYMEYVARRKLMYSQLAEHFAALGIQNEARKLAHSNSPDEYIPAYREFILKQRSPSALPIAGVVDTGSNLSYKRFRKIMATLGIECGRYDTRQVLIDERLLGSRNPIAHGERHEPDFEQYKELASTVIDMLTAIRDQITDAVIAKSYRAEGESAV